MPVLPMHLVKCPVWYTVYPAAVARFALGRPNRDWKPDSGNTEMPAREGTWRSQL